MPHKGIRQPHLTQPNLIRTVTNYQGITHTLPNLGGRGVDMKWMLALTNSCFSTLSSFFYQPVPCLKAALSKALGLAIVGGAIFVKVPQILKIVAARSGEGISIPGTILELIAMGFNISYSYVNQYPFRYDS